MTDTFSTDEREAMKDRAAELKAAARDEKDRAAGERSVLAKIGKMPDVDRRIAERLHTLITASAPGLTPQLWYGQPAYARDGKVVVFFQGSRKFKTRYTTLGFSDQARLDDGASWPTAYAITQLTAEDEVRFATLVAQAAG